MILVWAVLGALLFANAAQAAAPEWLRAASRLVLPKYPEDTDAVILLDEQETSVQENGEVKTVYRRACKILRAQGRRYATVSVSFDSETRLTFLKAWSFSPRGEEYEVKEKDAIETGVGEGLYMDTRHKILQIPAGEPGSIIGYELEQRRRASILQDAWSFQRDIPVRKAQFTLRLPAGWEFEPHWLNHPARDVQSAGPNLYAWELENVAPVEPEPMMPPWRALAGRLAIKYYPRDPALREKSHPAWRDVGRWYGRLAAGRFQATPEIRKMVVQLTAGVPAQVNKIRALAEFVQREIRYVAIEIGIGGYQPHAASEIFANRYGDCKDKVTLLMAMLREIGVESHYVLIHTDRGLVLPQFPSPLVFNHVIAGIRLPEENLGPFAHHKHERLGPLLYFDPTATSAAFGLLPAEAQSSHGLLVTEDGGEMVRLPLLAPTTNRLFRVGKLSLDADGTLSGNVREVRWGVVAGELRAQLLGASGHRRTKVLEDFLGGFLTGFLLTSASVGNLEQHSDNLVLDYSFKAEKYAQVAGNLLLLRPRVMGAKGERLSVEKQRKHPVMFEAATMHTDQFEITLPAGHQVDELPPPVQADYGFADYRSKSGMEGNVLRYQREYKIKDVTVPAARIPDLQKLYRQIANDERGTALLRRPSQ